MASGDNTGFGLDPRGGFWTSSSGGRLSSFGPKGEVRWQQDYMRGDYFPFPLAVDRDGNVWCAPKNIEKRAADGRLLASVDRTARSFLVEPGGNVLAIGYGVTRMAPDGTVMASFLAGYDPLIGKEDAAGTLWVATQPTTAHPWEVLAVSSDGSVKVSALQGQQTTSLAVDAAGNAWAVAREPGAIAHQVVGLTPDGKELATVKFTDQVWQVEVDPQGFLWVVTQHEQPPYESVLTQFRIER
jgi:sugar lactone lactonase YvrE